MKIDHSQDSEMKLSDDFIKQAKDYKHKSVLTNLDHAIKIINPENIYVGPKSLNIDTRTDNEMVEDIIHNMKMLSLGGPEEKTRSALTDEQKNDDRIKMAIKILDMNEKIDYAKEVINSMRMIFRDLPKDNAGMVGYGLSMAKQALVELE